MADHLNDPDGRGCRFANAAVELPEKSHPARRVIKAYKIARRRLLIRLCRAAGLSTPAMLADALNLLLEGAPRDDADRRPGRPRRPPRAFGRNGDCGAQVE